MINSKIIYFYSFLVKSHKQEKLKSPDIVESHNLVFNFKRQLKMHMHPLVISKAHLAWQHVQTTTTRLRGAVVCNNSAYSIKWICYSVNDHTSWRIFVQLKTELKLWKNATLVNSNRGCGRLVYTFIRSQSNLKFIRLSFLCRHHNCGISI